MNSRFFIFIGTTFLLSPVLAAPILSASTKNLTLSVKGLTLYGQTSGQSRVITITNKGNIPATKLSINYPSWPSGASINTTATMCTQGGTLAAGSSCTITIIPGVTATSGSNNMPCTTGIEPLPGIISLTANNTNSISINVVVLGYGCVYQGGYIYAMKETTSTSKSIGGTVTAIKDQAPIYPDGIIWSSNGNGALESDVSYIPILGIDTLSTVSNPSPTTPPYPAGTPEYTPCYGNADGICNSRNIVSYYNTNRTHGGNAPTPLKNYAAGLCSHYNVDASGNSPCITGECYNDWYLPAICDMGPDTDGSGCVAGTQNMTDNLPFLIGDPKQNSLMSCKLGINCLAGDYWSSTEFSINPKQGAWYESFASNGNSFQFNTIKAIPLGVRCSRTFN